MNAPGEQLGDAAKTTCQLLIGRGAMGHARAGQRKQLHLGLGQVDAVREHHITA